MEDNNQFLNEDDVDVNISKLSQALSELSDIFRNASDMFDPLLATRNVHNGTSPVEYWKTLNSNMYLREFTQEDRDELLHETVELNYKLLRYIGSVIPNLVSLIHVLQSIVEQMKRDDSLLNNRFYDYDCDISQLKTEIARLFYHVENFTERPRSYAIITGGKSYESNISGCNKPDSDTDRENN